MEPHLPHIEDGRLIVDGQSGSGRLVFSGYKPNVDPSMCGSYSVLYEGSGLQASWSVWPDDYQCVRFSQFVSSCAARCGEKFQENWGNPMFDIKVAASCDGLGHYNLIIEKVTSATPWFARVTIRLDTASMIELSRQLNVFMRP